MEPYKVIPEQFRCKTAFCKWFSHWLNPFGNWNEPMPYPEKRQNQAVGQRLMGIPLSPAIWWNLRNPLHNFNHYWIGIVPRGEQYTWFKPEQVGWVRDRVAEVETETYSYSFSWWKRPGHIPLPYFKWSRWGWEGYVGWMSRGSFGMAFRRD